MLMRAVNLFKYFGGEFLAIRDVSFDLSDGMLTSIIGPNGAGKTTLINLLSGSLKPDRGEIFFRDEKITQLRVEERVKKGICRSFQITNIFPELTVLHNVLIPLIYYHKRSLNLFSKLEGEKAIKNEGLRILEEVGLKDQAELKASHLSHGEQRQLEVGIALATHPELIFLDEPTQGMNKVEKANIVERIVHLSKEGRVTFVIVEHDMDVVFSVSDRIIVLHSGSIIADGAPEEIRNNELVREVYLGEEL